MNYFIVFIILSAFFKNATPKVYILNLTNRGTEDDRHIKLVDVLKHIKEDRRERKHEEPRNSEERSNDVDDCLMQLVTKAEKLKCLEKLHKPDKRMLSYIYPNYLKLVANRPKRTVYSLFNYYGDVVKSIPITDVSRQHFSQDYLDISDLSRIEPECDSLQCIEADSHKNKPTIQVALNYTKRNNQRRIFENVVQKSRSSSESSDSDDDSSDSDKRKESSDSDRKKRKDPVKGNELRNSHKRKEGKRQKPSRFQVVFNGDSAESESEERKAKSKEMEETDSEEDVTPKPIKKPVYSDSSSEEITEKPKTREKYAYLQGNKVYDNFRKRMQHFLPKRFHWDEDDMRHLGYYWFDGPRGKFDTIS